MTPPISIDGTDITGATIDGTDVQEITVDGQTVFTAVPAGAFDITQMTFDTSINTQDSAPRGIAWNDDGSRLYEIGIGGEKIYQSTVSTPFEITTASHSSGDTISTQDSVPTGIQWNNDGSRLYEVGLNSSKIFQYTVPTPFEITTASHSSGDSINTQGSEPMGIAWNDDGSRLYSVDRVSDEIYQYTVSTPFDITTASHSSGDSISTQDSGSTGIVWNNDGSRLYEVGEGSGKIYQYTVSTPFEITTASHSTGDSINAQDQNCSGIAWNNDGTRLYETGQSGNKIYQYTL